MPVGVDGWRALALALRSASRPPRCRSSLLGARPRRPTRTRHTLVLSLPGPFNGCTYLDHRGDADSDAILDLVTPVGLHHRRRRRRSSARTGRSPRPS